MMCHLLAVKTLIQILKIQVREKKQVLKYFLVVSYVVKKTVTRVFYNEVYNEND